MVLVVFVKVALVHDGLLVEKTFCKCVILALNPFCFTLSDT